MSDTTAKPTALLSEHQQLKAQLVPFAGFLLPMRYSGIFDEHKAVRERAGLFDLSHMGQLELHGDGALALLDRLSTNALLSLKVGKARYSILTDENGGAIDDIIVYRLPDRIFMVANAANTATVLQHLQSHAANDVRLVHRDDQALLALQGPKAAEILAPLVDTDLNNLSNYACIAAKFGTIDLLLARTGYTGEDGFELFLHNSSAPEVFRRLLQAGSAHGILPIGLGARDVLRLEAGMPLYGNELSATITPLQAGLDWAVKFDKGEFIGRTALYAQSKDLNPKLVGLQMLVRVPARSGYTVFAEELAIGTVCSASIAPSVGGASIATALIDAAHAEIGHTLNVEIRGTLYQAEVVALPFYRRARVSQILNPQ